MLELQSIGKRLGSFKMDDLTLSLGSGEYFVLLGPSGSGKTVLLEIVAGLIRPDRGRIFWQGQDITTAAPEARGFSIVYQDYALFPHMTVARNIAYGLRARGTKSQEAASRARSMARRLGIDGLLDRYPERLSGGEKQRVALARALVTRPQMLLLDEPLAALDANIRLRLQDELRRLPGETGTTFLHVTHDLEEAMYLGDRAGVILDGRIHQCAPPGELLERPANRQVAQFLGLGRKSSVVAAAGSRTGPRVPAEPDMSAASELICSG